MASDPVKRSREDEELEEISKRFKDQPCRFIIKYDDYILLQPLADFLDQRAMERGHMTQKECKMALKELDVLEQQLKAEMELNNAERTKGKIREAQKRNKEIKKRLSTVRCASWRYYNAGYSS